jgi:hypothetical protein
LRLNLTDILIWFPLWLKMLNFFYVFISHLYFFWEVSVQLIY